MEASKRLFELKLADESGKGKGEIEPEIKEKWEKAISQISCLPKNENEILINGEDLIKIGFYGKGIGEVKKALWKHVILNPNDNNKETLIDLAKNIYNNYGV